LKEEFKSSAQKTHTLKLATERVTMCIENPDATKRDEKAAGECSRGVKMLVFRGQCSHRHTEPSVFLSKEEMGQKYKFKSC
jgi:hypothetical protein